MVRIEDSRTEERSLLELLPLPVVMLLIVVIALYNRLARFASIGESDED
jgi:hypothetical protein